MDVDDIPPGADFATHIDAKVGSCDAMVVVKQGSRLQQWLKLHAGQRVRLTLDAGAPE